MLSLYHYHHHENVAKIAYEELQCALIKAWKITANLLKLVHLGAGKGQMTYLDC